MRINREPYPVYRQFEIARDWAESLDRLERRKQAQAAQGSNPLFWGQWPVHSTDHNVRRIPSGQDAELTARDEPVLKTSSTQGLETWLMFLRNDRRKAKMLLRQYQGAPVTTESEVMEGNEHQKAAQRIIDNIGLNTIRRDREGNVILVEQWVWDVGNNKNRQIVFRV